MELEKNVQNENDEALRIGDVMPRFSHSVYELSTDYKLLWKLINKGLKIPAWVVNHRCDFEEPVWDLVEVKMNKEETHIIGSRGIGYEGFNKGFSAFRNDCVFVSLHFVIPNCA